jgi:hypothetical protein
MDVNISKTKEAIEEMPDSDDGETAVIISFGLSMHTSEEIEIADLKALAESHTRLLETAKSALNEVSPECSIELRVAIAEAEK